MPRVPMMIDNKGDDVGRKIADLVLGITPHNDALDGEVRRLLARLTPSFTETTAQMRAVFSLGRHGWAVSSQSNLPAYATAAELYEDGSGSHADAILVAAWEQVHPTTTQVRLQCLAIHDDGLNDIMSQRAVIVRHAWDRHLAGDFISSVPVLLAQTEGLIADYSGGKMFFSRREDRRADVIDETSLTTIQEGLAEVRDTFSQGLDQTTLSGTRSRHGVLHGRSLGYSTRTFSAQCYSLFAAVLDWAQKRDEENRPPDSPGNHQ